MKLFLVISSLVLLAGCVSSQDKKQIEANEKKRVEQHKIHAGEPLWGTEAIAYFAEGCFWHTEIVFQSLEGVRDVVSGYAGGSTDNPNYEQIGTGKTGHAETVVVFYDQAKISFETLVKVFFASHDPTQLNRQGNDVGTQYRSIAFYLNDSQKWIIEKELKALTDSKKYPGKIVTEIKPLDEFYRAEEYHQEYIIHHPENPYVRNVSIPEYVHFRKHFDGKFKP